MTKESNITACIDFFVNDKLVRYTTDAFRARLVVGTLIALLISNILFYPIWAFTVEKPLVIGHIFLSLAIVLEIAVLLCQYVFKNITLSANLFTALFAACLGAAVYMTGGFQSPAISVLLVVPIVAIAMLGWRPALTWLIAIVVYIGVVYLLHTNGVETPRMIRQENIEIIQLIVWIFTGSCIFVAFATYEMHSDHLHRILEIEKEEYAYLSNHDPLTGLGNRHCFDKVINKLFQRGKTLDEPFALVYLDLNQFKPINDQYGHNFGDHVLKSCGDRIKSLIRNSDYAARIGGDEFAVILNGIADPSIAETISSKLQNGLSAPIFVKGVVLEVSASAGIAIFSDKTNSASELIEQADAAMYKAKHENTATHCSRKIKPVPQTLHSAFVH